jgi:hypothetical protein
MTLVAYVTILLVALPYWSAIGHPLARGAAAIGAPAP